MWDRFLRACRREPVDATPVWFMRQAGRYMAEYRAIRAKNTLLQICKQPELATEVTLQPVRAAADIEALRLIDPEESLGYVLSAIRMIRKELDGKTPLIGFAGAPFTL